MTKAGLVCSLPDDIFRQIVAFCSDTEGYDVTTCPSSALRGGEERKRGTGARCKPSVTSTASRRAEEGKSGKAEEGHVVTSYPAGPADMTTVLYTAYRTDENAFEGPCQFVCDVDTRPKRLHRVVWEPN